MPESNDVPVIKQGNKTYSLSQLIGKTIIANSDTNIYRLNAEQQEIYWLPFTGSKDMVGKSIYALRDNDVYDNATNTFVKKVKAGDYLGMYISGRPERYGWGVVFALGGKPYYVKGGKVFYFPEEYFSKAKNYVTTFKKGQTIGVLDSWVNGEMEVYNKKLKTYEWEDTGQIFLSFRLRLDVGILKTYYAPLKPNTINTKAIEQQGGMTTEEQEEAKDETEKTWLDKILASLGKGGKIVLGVGAGIYLVGKLIESRNKKQ